MAGRPASQKSTDERKACRFELFPSDIKLVPKDSDGLPRSPYPIRWIAPNAGTAVNPKTGEIEAWRYVYAFQKSIWESDQKHLTKSQIEDTRNEIVFIRGIIQCTALETAKRDALMIQDFYDKCENPINTVRPKAYFLIDQENHNAVLLSGLDDAFEAEKKAREMKMDDVFSVASIYGIDLNLSDSAIRTQLILKAKEAPKSFLRNIVDPKVKVRFYLLRALQEGLIASENGQVVWKETGAVQFEIKDGVDVADEIANRWAKNDKRVVKLVDTIKGLIEEPV